MDNIALLSNGITLLYRESQLEGSVDSSRPVLKEIFDGITLTQIDIGINTQRTLVFGLKDILKEMINDPTDVTYELDMILSRVRAVSAYDENVYKSIEMMLSKELSQEQLRRTVIGIRRNIETHLKDKKIEKLLREAYFATKDGIGAIADKRNFLLEHVSQLEHMTHVSAGKDPSIIGHVRFDNEESAVGVFESAEKLMSDEGLLRTGYQGLNKMLQGGFRRGEEVIINALPHKFKTGFTLNLFRQLCTYNKPFMRNPAKKPMMIRLSFEDEIETNMLHLWYGVVENETREKAWLGSKTNRQMSSDVYKALTSTGYHVEMFRIDPTDWTYKNITNMIMEYEASGFEIHCLMLDYLMQIPTTGCDKTGPTGTDLRDLFRRVRNFCGPRGITVITPHQMSPKATELQREGRLSLVKEVAEKGYTAGSTQLHQEVDLELNIHVVEYDEETIYFEIARGKHRGRPALKPEAKYMALQFGDYGSGILDDIFTDDSTLRKLGEKKASKAGATNSFKFSDDF